MPSRKARPRPTVAAATAPRGRVHVLAAVVILGGIVAGGTFVVTRSLGARAASRTTALSPAEPATPMEAVFLATTANTATPPAPAPDGMVWIPGGEFSMGSQDPPEHDPVGMQATEDS